MAGFLGGRGELDGNLAGGRSMGCEPNIGAAVIWGWNRERLRILDGIGEIWMMKMNMTCGPETSVRALSGSRRDHFHPSAPNGTRVSIDRDS